MSRRWQPFQDVWGEMARLQSEMNRQFGRMGDGLTRAESFPPVNVWEDDDRLYVEAELPGLKVEELEIYVTGGNQLTLKGERRPPEVEGAWHRRERGHGGFIRTVELPVMIDSGKVEAACRDGVLVIELPKREEVKPRRIQVKVS